MGAGVHTYVYAMHVTPGCARKSAFCDGETYRCDEGDWRRVVKDRARIHSCRADDCVVPTLPTLW